MVDNIWVSLCHFPQLTHGLASTAPLVYDPDMADAWDANTQGVLALPSGRLIRGRALKLPAPDGPSPAFGLYLLARKPPATEWASRWVFWPDFRLPSNVDDATAAFREAWERSERERVEVACAGGQGRTGTTLACLAVLDGVPLQDAVRYVRDGYSPHAVETPEQEEFISRFAQVN